MSITRASDWRALAAAHIAAADLARRAARDVAQGRDPSKAVNALRLLTMRGGLLFTRTVRAAEVEAEARTDSDLDLAHSFVCEGRSGHSRRKRSKP